MQLFDQKIIVGKDHIDFNNHVNNLVYMRWALEISRAHWLAKIDEEIDDKYYWMVRSHHAEYKKQAFLGDELVVETYVEGYRGPFSERIVRICKGNDLLVEVKSNWCLIERESQKLKRVPEEIQSLFK